MKWLLLWWWNISSLWPELLCGYYSSWAWLVRQKLLIYVRMFEIEMSCFISCPWHWLLKHSSKSIEVSTVETLYSTIYYSKYFIELHIDKSTQYVVLWTHKRHSIPRPLWSVFYEYFNRNWSCYKGFLLYHGWWWPADARPSASVIQSNAIIARSYITQFYIWYDNDFCFIRFCLYFAKV